MKRFVVILFLLGCSPKIVPVQQNYKTAVQVSFANDITSDFFIQINRGNEWQNVKSYLNLPPSYIIDTVSYIPGLYRIKCSEDSSQVFPIK